MADNEHKNIVEALIFAADFPIPISKICQIIDDIGESEAASIIEELEKDYSGNNRGMMLKQTAGGYEFVTKPEYALWVKRLAVDKRRMRLSRPSLETAAIIAFRQPISRVEIEKIRGVDSGGPLRTLLERRLIQIAGREKSPGRPLLYVTSNEFLHFFGVNSLSDLPQLEEIEDIIRYDAGQTEVALESLSLPGRDSGAEEM